MTESCYCCIYCKSPLFLNNDTLLCPQCSSKFQIRQGIPIFAEKERYWCNLPKDKMIELNHQAGNTYWKDAINKYIGGDVANHIAGKNRFDFRYLLPSLEKKRILDVGSMWGGISIPASGYAKEVYSIDTTYETLEFLAIRKKQDNINNINIAVASAYKLPFADDFFDVVFLIGVLEWLGCDYDFVVSEQYGRRSKVKYKNKNEPHKLQFKALSEIFRVLKDGGVLLIAIENRFFYKYFLGCPDAHTRTPFSSILPRPLANIYMRLLKNQDYCEYTYSYNQYKKILKNSGFNSISFYSAMPSYREPEVMLPLDNDRQVRFYYENYGLRSLSGLKKLIPQFIIRLNLMKHFVPSFIILSEKIKNGKYNRAISKG